MVKIRKQNCGSINKGHIKSEVEIAGWLHRSRDHGGVIFFDVRDQSGLVQVVFNPEDKEIFTLAEACRNEYVIRVRGKVRSRPKGTVNKDLTSGEIEIVASNLSILNSSKPLPFNMDEYSSVGEETRLKYRFLDLRREDMQKKIGLRSKTSKAVRNFLEKKDFLEIETPIVTKATPEGARD